MQFSPPNLDTTISVISAMITPAVLILATGSLILTTTNRLVRVVDRVRAMLPEFEQQAAEKSLDALQQERRDMLFRQLDRATIRARLIQKALARLYIALSVFLATSVALGVIALVGALAFSGLGLLIASRVRTIEAVSGLRSPGRHRLMPSAPSAPARRSPR